MSAPPGPDRDLTEAAVDRLVAFYQRLSPESLAKLGQLYAPGAYFKDPFNEVSGVTAIAHIFEHMFATVTSPRFRVTGRIVQARQAMLAWEFDLMLRGQAAQIRGVSHLIFDSSGRVTAHRDYWDAAGELYEKLPVLGVLMRRLRRSLSAG